jgi:hypothetical protein
LEGVFFDFFVNDTCTSWFHIHMWLYGIDFNLFNLPGGFASNWAWSMV